jgi:hypothetical protein
MMANAMPFRPTGRGTVGLVTAALREETEETVSNSGFVVVAIASLNCWIV